MTSKRTLLLIHGMWGGAWCWDVYRPFFEARGYRCVVPTLRHHEPEADPPPPELGRTSLLDYVADLEKEVRALDVPPVVVGHSMGGLLAQMLAGRGRAAAAVCLTPAPPMGILAVRRPSVLLAFLEAMPGILAHKPVRTSYRAARYAIFNRLSEGESRRLYDQTGYESGRAISEIGMRTYRGVVPHFDPDRATDVDAEKVACRMLVVGAKHDRITPLPIAARVAAKYGADYEEFSDLAHWVLGGPGWEEVAGCVADWIARLGGPAPYRT